MFDSSRAGDFQALWLAGEFYQLGQFDQIYPPDTEFFTTRPSPEWIARVAADGQETAIYSYIYPPLWAALMAPLTTVTNFQLVSEIAGYLNPALLGGMLFLAWRTCTRSGMQGLPAWGFVAIGYAIFLTTTIGLIGLAENQVQIFVSFLILLALEREQAGAPVSAGVAMGLAAALKLYPVFLVLFWLAQGKWRVTVIATTFGCVLGALSIALTGWELHAIFLEQLALISNTLLLNSINYAFEVGIANLCCQNQMSFVISSSADLSNGVIGGHLSMAKPDLWAIVSKGLLLISLTILALISFRLRKKQTSAFWPLALCVIPLISPLGWSHQFLPAASFAPSLLALFGWKTGAQTIAIAFIPTMLGLTPIWNALTTGTNLIQFVGLLCMLAYAATWGIVLKRQVATFAEEPV
ncbi:glycosyltransferase family 87 protein [Halocynthiibacter sp. C4]|uniref:glycosyltransferase family 87 protein n=1 Tax=Halocynthiibacter sp. C4 TaxID=2992758 RepID=UPI00237AE214|nr:glycosyltransferase family 87 protein [Halocynthiibacter sp. C4]MDE0590255.1 glycosyltransferase family 87 protein [Halocynthiibacter sp. C4]